VKLVTKFEAELRSQKSPIVAAGRNAKRAQNLDSLKGNKRVATTTVPIVRGIFLNCVLHPTLLDPGEKAA